MASTQRIAKKRKFVADGVMFAEITELLGKVRRRGAITWLAFCTSLLQTC